LPDESRKADEARLRRTSTLREVTFGLRKTGGRWQIAHLHGSVPFYMDQTFKAAVDLQP
jgi:ketosteroid isomerase-like protein